MAPVKLTITVGGREREIELPEDTVRALSEIAQRRNLTLEAALRQAIQNENFIEKEIDGGSQLLIRKGDTTRELEYA